MARRTGLLRTKRFFGDSRGIAAVEFAIVLPFLMLMLFGMIEIGRALFHYHAVTKSVRDATRYLTRVGMTCGSHSDSS